MNKFEYKNLTPFKWFVLENFPFIEADFDALTNWQLFCKLGKEMNKIINSQNIIGTQMENVTNAFIELQNYVENYFKNLDVQKEINNKLDDMVEQGTLQEIITSYLNSKALFCYDTVALMKQATNLIDGSYTKTLGFYAKNDGGSSIYKIRTKTNEDIIDEMKLLSLYDNTLVAEFIENKYIYNIMQFGLNIIDSSSNITNKINSILNFNYNLLFDNLEFIINDSLNIKSNTILKFQNCHITNESSTNKKYIFNIENVNNINIEGINTIIEFNKPSTDQQACIHINDSKNINIKGFEIKKAGGDGILINGTTEKQTENINISDNIIDNNRRNGISAIGGVFNLIIDNCKIINTSGINPQFAIDLEPWQDGIYNDTITIKNCYFNNNIGGIDILSQNKNIIIENNTFDANGINSVMQVALGENKYPKNILIQNNNFINDSQIYLRGTQFAEYNILNNSFNNAVIQTDTESDYTSIKNGIPKSGFLNIKNNIFNDNTKNAMITLGGTTNVIISDNRLNNCYKRAFTILTSNNVIIKNNIIRNYQMYSEALETDNVVLIQTSNNVELINNEFYKDETLELILNNLIVISSNTDNTKLINNKASIGNYLNLISNSSTTTVLINNESKTLLNDTTKFRPSPSEKYLGMIYNRYDTTNNVYIPSVCVYVDGSYKWKDL